VDKFISEDDLTDFDRWLKYQAVDAASLTTEQFGAMADYLRGNEAAQ
jgi:hypothetical protein